MRHLTHHNNTACSTAELAQQLLHIHTKCAGLIQAQNKTSRGRERKLTDPLWLTLFFFQSFLLQKPTETQHPIHVTKTQDTKVIWFHKDFLFCRSIARLSSQHDTWSMADCQNDKWKAHQASVPLHCRKQSSRGRKRSNKCPIINKSQRSGLSLSFSLSGKLLGDTGIEGVRREPWKSARTVLPAEAHSFIPDHEAPGSGEIYKNRKSMMLTLREWIISWTNTSQHHWMQHPIMTQQGSG